MKTISILFASSLFGAASVAGAAPVSWTVTGNAYLSGSFMFDADTNTYSNFNVMSTGVLADGIDYSQAIVAYQIISPTEYLPVYGPTSPVGNSTAVTVTGTNSRLELRFDAPLTGFQDVPLSVISMEHLCENWMCAPADFMSDGYLSSTVLGGGTLTPTAVPVPAPIALLASGLVGMVAASWRKKTGSVAGRE